jgi:hypothetical protein
MRTVLWLESHTIVRKVKYFRWGHVVPTGREQDIRKAKEVKIFDPRDPSTGSQGEDLLDATVCLRGNQWWMYLAGQAGGYGATELFSASLSLGAPLSAGGWKLRRDSEGKLVPLAANGHSNRWDGNGGRHCPSYVTGFDSQAGRTVERIYYAGASENLWGPYTIGFLEWNGEEWIDQAEAVFVANEAWEHGSVYEPNLIYHDGKWKMWYVAGSNQENYLVHGYAESADGRSGWTTHSIFAPPDMKMFDFCVRQRGNSFDAIFSRVWVAEGVPSSETGLWWCQCAKPSGNFSHWGQPTQIMTAEDRGWHSGPWKPSFQFDAQSPGRAFVFFDGLYRTSDPGPFPFAFTQGCVEIELPAGRGHDSPRCDHQGGHRLR